MLWLTLEIEKYYCCN